MSDSSGTARRPCAALYVRTSTDRDQRPDLQIDDLRRMAEQRRWQVVGEYVDVGHSGAKDRRPELDRLMTDVHQGRVGIVAVWRFDRFARSVRHLVMTLDDLRARHIEFVSLHDGIDTSTPAGRFTFHVIAAVAELERELIRERTRAGLAAARRRGARIGRPRVSVDVTCLRQLQAEGCSIREIARRRQIGASTVHRLLRSGTRCE